MRIIFMGTPDFAVPTLAALLAAGHDDRGRLYPAAARRGPWPCSAKIARAALRRSGRHSRAHAGAPQEQATSRSGSARFDADAAVVVAYGLILPHAILDGTRAWRLQSARLAPAALARRRAHPARDHGRRHRDRRDGDAHGRGARHRPRLPHASACRSAPRRRRASCMTGWPRLAPTLMVEAPDRA